MEVFDVLKTPKARLNFLKGLIRVAKSDGRLDDKELAFYHSAATTFGLGEPEMKILTNCWECNENIDVVFDTNKEKMFFFVQAIQLCWVDNDYAEAEKKEINNIARELYISPEAINAVEEWVYEGIVWNRKCDKLLELK